MAKSLLPLTLAVAEFPHTKAILSGRIPIEGVEPHFANVQPQIAAYRRMVREVEFDVCELAPTTYIIARAHGAPFVALPIFVSLEALPHSLLEASNDLGASRWTTFWRITFPMSIPGVIAAFIFVFIPTIGEYITPQIVGGPKGYLFGNTIQSSFLASFDWQLGSAMGIFLVGVVAVLIMIFGRYLNTGAAVVE